MPIIRGGRRKKFRGGGSFEKISIITARPVFKNLAPPGILFMPPSKKNKIKKNNNNIGNTYYFVHNRDSLILKYNL
jgi:hypothetical protein